MPDVPSLFSAQESDFDDIGYVLGWFCGGALLLGAIVAVVYLNQGSPRKAFQAIVLPVVVVIWFFGVLGLAVGAGEDSILVLWLGLPFLPILGVYVLRKIRWPAARGTAP